MCSWCWGFQPALAELRAGLPPEIRIVRLLGGLAPESDEPMAAEMRAQLQQTWRRIQHQVPGTVFNFDFWTRCSPRRSTYPACRAVIAARCQDPSLDEAMTLAIQRAYYLEARNPSDQDTLIALAGEIGAEAGRFAQDLTHPETRRTLEAEIARARHMGVVSFPSLVLDCAESDQWRVPVEYGDAKGMLRTLGRLIG
jgi:putative protein-disulfide isomerase